MLDFQNCQRNLTTSSGEITFSKSFGFLESGKDVDDMMRNTGRVVDYTGTVRTDPFEVAGATLMSTAT